MNEVFKKVEEILEELRCEAEEREYFVQTEQAEKAAQELKKAFPSRRASARRRGQIIKRTARS